MAQHFLLSKAAKTLSLATIFTMKDEDAEMTFRRIRWADTEGEPVCPHCGGADAYDCRRLKGAPRFRCRACVKDFSITSGTLFASHKLPLRAYLAAIAIFVNEVKGKSALALSRDLNLSYKSAFVLLHKLREAMAEDLKGRVVGSEGKVAEVDGGYFGDYMKPANLKRTAATGAWPATRMVSARWSLSSASAVATRCRRCSRPKRKPSHSSAPRIAKGTVVNADEAKSWEGLEDRFEMRRINHEEAYSFDGACTNMAEEYFSRLRRAEAGHHHHIAGPYLLRYAQEASWREDNRRDANGSQVERVTALAMKKDKSVDFTGYWQRHNERAAQ